MIPYAALLKEILRAVNLSDLLVQGPPPPVLPWAILPVESQGRQSMALAFDDHILKDILDAFKAPEPCLRLVDQTSQYRVPQAIYPRFIKAPPLDDQVVLTTNPRGTMPNSVVLDHRKVVEALYEAFMGAFCIKWHMSVLMRYL